MTQKTFTRHDYLSIDDITTLNTQMTTLAAKRREILGEDAALSTLNTSMGVTTMATVDLINQIERNIDALAGAAPPAAMQTTRTWLGEARDVPLLSFRDVNRWFESLALIKASLMGRGFDFKATGGYVAGNCGIRQKIRGVD